MAQVEVNLNKYALHLTDAIVAAGIRALNATLDNIEKNFQDTVSTFDEKPQFHKQKAHRRGSQVVGSVYTDDENYSRLNYGTTPHPVNTPLGSVVYMGYGYRSKTHPGKVRATVGGYSGHHFRTKTIRWRDSHIEARNFVESIRVRNQAVFQRFVTEELKKL